MKMRHIKKHKLKDKIECTHFVKTKLCAFIFAFCKNAIDCKIIDIPLNDNIPEHSEIERFEIGMIESSFAPLVTSTIPKMTPLISAGDTLNGFARYEIIVVKKEKIFKYTRSSDKR